MVQAITQKATMPKLRNLTIAGATIGFGELCVFAKRHTRLQKVKAERCELRGIETYQKSFGEENLEQKMSEVLDAELEYLPTPWYE